jgi:hypothetical protein
LHKQKSRIINLSKGVDFVGFRNFYYFLLLRKRNSRNIERKINLFKEDKITKEKFYEIFQGWNAYAKWANGFKLRMKISRKCHPKTI